MQFIKISLSDLYNIFKNRIIRVSVVAIIIIPLLYSFFYLYAFWDPYKRLDKLPVAVVNLDEGGVNNGATVNVGKQLTETLRDSDQLEFHITNAKDAGDGLKGKKYYATYTIPKDFTAKFLSGKEVKPIQPKIIYSANEKRNFIAGQINGKASLILEQQISKILVGQYTGQAFDNLYKLKNGMGEAAKGSTTLSQGLGTAKDGSSQMSDGIYQLKSNIPLLTTTMNNLYNGTASLASKLQEAGHGATALSVGAAEAYSGAKQVNAGVQSLNTNLSKVNTSMTTLNGQLTSVKNSISASNPQAAQQLSSILAGYTQVSTGISSMSSSVNGQLLPATNSLASGTLSLQNGADKLSAGVNQAVSGANTISNGMSQVNAMVPTLSDGVSKLYDASSQLASGLSQLSSGSQTLSSSLNDGSKQLNSSLVSNSDTMSKFVSDAVKVEDSPLHHVKNYGTGFAPYFISLSLYVGAMLMFFVISAKVDPNISANKASRVVGKFFSYGYIGVFQAVLAAIIVLCLGLHPKNILLYFLFLIFMSYVFIAINQCLVFLLGSAGRMLAIVLLILQLTASGGTFPNDLVPKFFNVINPFMPFTYTISALREIISGVDYSVVGIDFCVLLLIMGVCITLSVLFLDRAQKMQEIIEEKKSEIVI